ncbi:MAG: vWA domain-containing protein [Ktedonobacteraceae bacterium]|nr:VWA domain-containing protein [Chloroflexota bacterium]
MSGMLYTQPATSLTPALVVYLIDASHSMNDPCNGTTRMDIVNKALKDAIKDMVRRSIRDGIVQRRYKVAIFAYSTTVVDVLDGIRDLPELVKHGVPVISAGGETDTTNGFRAVEMLLQKYLAHFQAGPAPLVCHLTDALITASDPTPVVRRIQSMTVPDGPVLVENVYVADKMLRASVHDWHHWSGVARPQQLTNDYARLLFRLSSLLPETYCQNINNYGYHLQPGAALFFPGTHIELVRLAFAISTATQLK